MSGEADLHEINRKVAVLEERMKTMQAEYRTDIGRLAEQIAQRDALASERMASATDRMASSRWWQTAIILAGIGVATALILSFLPA